MTSNGGWRSKVRYRQRVIGRLLVGLALALAIAYTLVPSARAFTLVRRATGADDIPGAVAGLAVEDVSFSAADGVGLSGWLIRASDATATVVLTHGFKTNRTEMLPWAAFLHAAGYDVLLFDSRGCGRSEGTPGLGVTEPRDITGAVSFVKGHGGAAGRRVAVLGISLGAGAAILAAAGDPDISGVVADSPWADEHVQIEHMRSISIAGLSVPLLPYELPLVDRLIGGSLESAAPRAVVERVAPRPLLLIRGADDDNATTTLADSEALYSAAGEPKALWIVHGAGHAGALMTDGEEYRVRVLRFLQAVTQAR